jgi:subtilisin family serine protease
MKAKIHTTERIGPLLEHALRRMESAPSEDLRLSLASDFGGDAETGRLQIVAQSERIEPERGEGWERFRERSAEFLDPLARRLAGVTGDGVQPLLAAGALQFAAKPGLIRELVQSQDHLRLELDPLVEVVSMDDVVPDVELPLLESREPDLDGRGVTVAVLDSGIDTQHPWLSVHSSHETCGESVDQPGAHGTHCAGSIASRDNVYRGIAPGVTLINVKVLRANGTGRETFIARGIDVALDQGAEVISMSLGFNHLPTWSDGGHGWACPEGRCVLCTAVRNAVISDGCFVVVAAGNEHERAEALRSMNLAHSFDTEIGCPGQCPEAFTVGAVHKRTFATASFSSRGPTAFGADKPDLAAPGVNVRSSIPVPRSPSGKPVQNPARNLLSARMSGTSMSTPVVAGAAALAIQQRKRSNVSWSPQDIRDDLLNRGCAPLQAAALEVGAGRLSLRHF